MKTNPTVNLLLCSVVILVAAAAPLEHNNNDQLVVKCELTEDLAARLQDLESSGAVDPLTADRDNVLVRLSAHTWAELQSTIPECSVAIANLKEYLTKEAQTTSQSDEPEAKIQNYLKEYFDLDDIITFYSKLPDRYKGFIKFGTLGDRKTYEGRPLYAVEITAANAPKKTIYMQCLIHAREWISGPTCMYMAEYLLEKYKAQDQDVKYILDNAKFVIVPVVNPDGYAYTREDKTDPNHRVWRKNRKPTHYNKQCKYGDSHGVDINRNFPYQWSKKDNLCSSTYSGLNAGSEPETNAIMEYFKSLPGVVAAIDMHSFSQLILRPYGWKKDGTPDEALLKKIGDEMANIVQKVNGETYKSGTGAELLGYLVGGGSRDWFYQQNSNSFRPASFTFELRPTLESVTSLKNKKKTELYMIGFGLPADQIEAVCKEVTPAIIFLAKTMLKNPLKYKPQLQ